MNSPPISGQHWLALIVVAGTVVACLIIRHLIRRLAASGPRDPVRLFTQEDKRWGRHKCGQQCEMSNPVLFWTRCDQPAEHADHWWPWSQGGATTRANMVMACAAHNLAKTDRWPSSRGDGARIGPNRAHLVKGTVHERQAVELSACGAL